jgi:hypothetical protein
MKYRLIKRRDGKYQYEYAPLIRPSNEPIVWYRIEYMTFGTEEIARGSIQEIINFARAAEVEKVIDEIEI